MKTLFFIYYSLGIGGIEQKIIDMVSYVRKTRPQVRIVVIVKNPPPGASRENEIQGKQVRLVRYYETKWSHVRFFFPLFVMAKVYAYKPMAVMAFSFIPSISAILAKLIISPRTRTVIDIDGSLRVYELNQPFVGVRKFLMQMLFPYADYVVTVNTALKKELRSLLHLTSGNIRLLTNWVMDIPKRRSFGKKQYDLVYIGRLEPVKQVDMLLTIIAKVKKTMPHIACAIVGTGSEEGKLRRLGKTLGIEKNCTFTGFSHEPSTYLILSRIFVCPSRSEGMSFALLQALSYGLPVVSYQFPAAHEVIKHAKNGFVYKTIDEGALYSTMLLKNAKKRRAMGVHAKLIVEEKFSEKQIEPYMRLLGI